MSIPYDLLTRNVEVPDHVRRYLEEKLQSLEHLIDSGDSTLFCQIELSKTTEHHQSGKVFRAEANLRAGGAAFRAVAEGETLEEALDEVKDELKIELSKHKDKNMSLLRRGGARLKSLLRFGRAS